MDKEDLEYINQNMLGCSEDMSESFNNEITDKIISTLKSLGYDCYSKDVGWEDEEGNPVEWEEDRDEPEDGWWYNTIPYYLCKNNKNQVQFSWRISEADKIFTIEGLYANYKESVKGFATKTLEELFKIIPSGWNIHINWNQNAGYWNHMKEKHSEYTWKDVSESLDLSEAYFSDSEKEIYMTDEMYKLKNMFNNSSASFRCVYDFSENFVGFCELDLEIHDTLERTMYKYADHMPKFGRFIEFSKKFYDKNSLDDEIDYYNIELVQYEYENFFIVWLEEDSSFRDTELFKALGEPINTLKYIKESKNLKEDEPWNISHRGYTNFYDGSKASALEKISNYVGYTVTEDDLDYLKEVAEADDDEELLGYIEYYYKADESLNETIDKSFIEYCKDRNIKFKNEEGVLTFDSFRDMLKCIQLLMDMHIPYKQDNKSVIVDKKYLEEKIVKKGSKWQVQSEKGKNMGTYDTKADAEKRLGQIEYFKHMNEDVSRQEVISDVEHTLGTTDENVEGPSYILPNGKFLKIWDADIDINGMSGGQSRSGKAQHLDVDGYIRKKYPESKIGMWGRYLEKDCIRVNSGFEEYVVLPEQRPNDTQLDSLMRWLDTYFLEHEKIEVIPPDYKWSNRKEYYGTEIISDEIIKKIKKYYGTGVLDEDKSSHLEIKTSFEDIDKYLHEHYTFSNHIDENNSSQLIDKEGRFFNSGKYEYYHGNLLNELIDAGLISVGEDRLDQYNYINTTLFGDIGYVRCNDSEGDYIQLPENITEAQINAISKWIDERYLGHGYTVIDVGCESLKTFVRYMFEYDESHQADDFMKMIRRFKNSHTLVEDIKQTEDRFDTIAKTEKDLLNRFLEKYGFELEILTDDDAVDWYNPYTMNSVGMFVGDVQDNASVFPVALNKELILKLCKEEDIDLEDAIKGTLWHEAGHGIYRFLQDTHDMPEDEEECVEEFAREVENSELYDILEKSMTESIKENTEYTTTVYTYQSPDVLKQLKSNKTYIADSSKGMFSGKSHYDELKRILNLKHSPIFGAIDEDELYDMIVASGLETSNRTQLLKLEVPSSEVHKMNYYDWTDYIYFWIDKQEKDTLTKEQAEDELRHYIGEGPCQVVIDRIEPEWLVSDEDVTAENPFSKEEIEKDLDDIHNWLNSKKDENLNESKADIQKFRDYVGDELADKFFRLKDRLQGNAKDIYYWMSLEKQVNGKQNVLLALEDYLDEIGREPTRSQVRRLAEQGAEKVYEDSRWLVLKINTYEASVKYGKDTKWCVTGNNSEQGRIDFERHTADASLYFYIDKQRKRNKYALEYQDAENWCLFDSEDWPEVGYGNQFNNALDVSGGTCWSPYDTDRYPALPHVNGLPDLQQAYKDAIADISEDSLDANDFIAEKLHKTERFDMFETNSAYDAKNYLVNSKESLRVFIDEHTDEYLICKEYEATHSDMIDYANSELALDTYIDDYDNKKICLIYVPNSDLDFDEQSDAYDDDYDMCYEYDTFRIYSRYINFRNFELYKILGKVKNVKRIRL